LLICVGVGEPFEYDVGIHWAYVGGCEDLLHKVFSERGYPGRPEHGKEVTFGQWRKALRYLEVVVEFTGVRLHV
jgi:hypothetical protein